MSSGSKRASLVVNVDLDHEISAALLPFLPRPQENAEHVDSWHVTPVEKHAASEDATSEVQLAIFPARQELHRVRWPDLVRTYGHVNDAFWQFSKDKDRPLALSFFVLDTDLGSSDAYSSDLVTIDRHRMSSWLWRHKANHHPRNYSVLLRGKSGEPLRKFRTKSPVVAGILEGAIAASPRYGSEVVDRLANDLPIAEMRVKSLYRSQLVALRDELLSEPQIRELDLGITYPHILAPIAGEELERRNHWRTLRSNIIAAALGAIIVLIIQAMLKSL